jgi:hypothetical protein
VEKDYTLPEILKAEKLYSRRSLLFGFLKFGRKPGKITALIVGNYLEMQDIHYMFIVRSVIKVYPI